MIDKGWWKPGIPVVLLVVMYAVVVLRRAWVCDDAYITFRTIDNLVNGYRLTWNVGERVQAYTHPLWMLVMSVFYYITREIYLTSIAVSLAMAVAGVVVYVVGVARRRYQAALGVLILSLSNAYVDYSTSGLENALSHLLLVVYVALYVRMGAGVKKVLWMSVVASLGIVNRMDMGLLYAPLLALVWWESGERLKGLAAGVLGQMPFVLWEVFSLVYYGFPFPNTAYAKLNTGIPAGELFQQGVYYVINSLQRDPITLAMVLLAVVLAIVKGNRLQRALALGVTMYILYVVKIGGDFMSGRFFAAPLLGACMLFSRLDLRLSNRKLALGMALLPLFVGTLAPLPTWRVVQPEDMPLVDAYGIADERLWYFSGLGLFDNGRIRTYPAHFWVEEGKRAAIEHAYGVVTQEGIGLFGYYAGQKVHIVDIHALSDPLLARIPAKRWVNWQIGHFERVVPQGYLLSLEDSSFRLADERLQEYYEKLKVITRAPLLNGDRLVEIWRMNTGQYDHLIDRDKYQYPAMISVSIFDVSGVTPEGMAQGEARKVVFFDSGLEILLGMQIPGKEFIEIALDGNDHYRIVYLRENMELASQVIHATRKESGLVVYRLPIPGKAQEAKFDRIRIFPLRWAGFTLAPARGDDQFGLGYIKLVDMPD
ncbi:MAG: hypothetical protein HPY45_02810 [Anaerolineae bacterium]|nr:hypothetical protein [Anaerolineae bacterium]